MSETNLLKELVDNNYVLAYSYTGEYIYNNSVIEYGSVEIGKTYIALGKVLPKIRACAKVFMERTGGTRYLYEI